ncbi:MAG TPA: hypothetical protein VIJ87_04515 [Pyrinomonadaceae bacterium]|jgi:hypothetical protein
MTLIPVQRKMCGTCPFRPRSKYGSFASVLTEAALTEGSRICHNTGENDFIGKTGKPERLCRGARDIQLKVFAAAGVITAPTDEAWAAKCDEMGLR